jgi:thiamine-phosphate pyrophosphorylase
MEMTVRRKITSGLYLVIDPSMEEWTLLQKLEIILKEEIAAVQVWDNFFPGQNIKALLQEVVALCHSEEVPVLINNRWEYMMDTSLDGVHFDCIPADFAAVRRAINRPFITGLTCNNDLTLVRWADQAHLDYVSFCSVFPSATSTSCELVRFESISEAKRISTIPVFLAGGIKPGNMEKLDGLNYDGIAVISGIMSAGNPAETIKEYLKILKRNKV